MLLMVILFFICCVFFMPIPIILAKNRGVSGAELKKIKVLSFIGMFVPFCWLIAFIFAMVADNSNSSTQTGSNLDRLEKAYNLMKKGVISKKEFEKIKSESI